MTLALCLFCTACVSSVQLKDALSILRTPSNIESPAVEITVPLEISSEGRAYVTVEYDGKPFLWMVNTGAPVTMISDQEALTESLALIKLPHGLVSGISGGTDSSVAVMPKMFIGGLLITKLPVVVVSLDDWNRKEKSEGGRVITGILGANFLKYLQASVNYATNTLTMKWLGNAPPSKPSGG